MTPLTDPATRALLRLEVGRLRARERRRRFDSVVHLGVLGGDHGCCPVPAGDPVVDPGTRTDVVSRLLDAAQVSAGPSAPSVWLTRPGDPVLQDDDLAWLAASSRAFGAFGRGLAGFWSVTRTGWLDVRTGERHTWTRLRL